MSLLRAIPAVLPRPLRAAAIASAALIFAVVFPTPASAEELTVRADRTAWFWESNEKVTTCTSDGVQNLCGGASANGAFGNNPVGTPISPGHLGVGVKDGGSDMRAYVKFDLSDMPFGATVSEFVVTFTVSKPDRAHAERHGADPGAKVPGTFNEGDAVIQVCAAAEAWGTAEGDPPSSTTVVRPRPESGNTAPETSSTRAEPTVNCGLSAAAKFSNDGSKLVADITNIAAAWGSGSLLNEGIALRPVVQGVKPNWTVELHGAKTTADGETGTITYVTDAEAVSAKVSYSAAAAGAPPTGGGFEPPPAFPSFGSPIPVDPGPAPPPAFGGPVAVAPPTGGGGPTMVGSGTTKGETPAWFFGLFPLGALVLGLVSGMIGPDTAPATAGAPSRVASVLRSRRLER